MLFKKIKSFFLNKIGINNKSNNDKKCFDKKNDVPLPMIKRLKK